MKLWTYLHRLIGNNPKASIGVGLFILILILLSIRTVKAAEIDLRAGSLVVNAYGPVLGMSIYQPLGNRVDGFASAILWGSTTHTASNWSWQAGMRTCRWQVCASLGASYLKNQDYLNDSNLNFNLEFAWHFNWKRVNGIELSHLSDAGTSPSNRGRNAALVSIRLQ